MRCPCCIQSWFDADDPFQLVLDGPYLPLGAAESGFRLLIFGIVRTVTVGRGPRSFFDKTRKFALEAVKLALQAQMALWSEIDWLRFIRHVVRLLIFCGHINLSYTKNPPGGGFR